MLARRCRVENRTIVNFPQNDSCWLLPQSFVCRTSHLISIHVKVASSVCMTNMTDLARYSRARKVRIQPTAAVDVGVDFAGAHCTCSPRSLCCSSAHNDVVLTRPRTNEWQHKICMTALSRMLMRGDHKSSDALMESPITTRVYRMRGK